MKTGPVGSFGIRFRTGQDSTQWYRQVCFWAALNI